MRSLSPALLLVALFPLAVLSADNHPAANHPAVQVPTFIREWGREGDAEGEFQIPIGIAVSKADELLITDFQNERVQRFDSDGNFLSAFTVDDRPSGIALDSEGNIYVALFDNCQITLFTPDGTQLRTWGREGQGDGETISPAGLAVGPDGNVYLGDDVNRRIQKFSPEGEFLLKWGRGGAGPGEFGGEGTDQLPAGFRTSGPNFLAFDSNDILYATDGRGGKVHRFTTDGEFVSRWGDNEDKPGSFGGRPGNLPGPTGLCIDQQDRVWVAATSNRIQLFTATGEYLLGFGKPGSAPAEFQTPHGLALDSQGNLYVVDTQNHRIQKFSPP